MNDNQQPIEAYLKRRIYGTRRVFETGHGIGETGIVNNACTHKNDAVEKHEARSVGQDFFETLEPSQENPNESNKGLYGDEAQLSDGSSEDLAVLDTESCEGSSGLGLICFGPDPEPDAQQNAETAADAYSIGLYYLKLREKFGIKPVRVHNRKTVMRAIVRAAVHGIIKHCLREKQNEDCPGCTIDAPGQRHHDCVYWSLDVNCKIKDISSSLCLESVLNIIITLGYALQCLCLTQEHLALGAELMEKVTEAEDPNSISDEIIKPTDKGGKVKGWDVLQIGYL
ncbi:uncharacterized protein LOC135983858 [Chrysemys picta bellii]|uniref:uncharacterized protein LOC135983858 n=1 Tax=Chrysemys picta bellii TaxID=8478 RepID=UPI0032B154EA